MQLLSTKYLVITIKLILVIIFFILFVRTFLIELGSVNGLSMEENFFDNEIFIVNKLTLLFRKPERKDVVQVMQDDKLVIKRIIGLPGEEVIIRKGKVYIKNNKEEIELKEDYLKKYIVTKSEKKNFILGEHEYFVLGDNREESIDSRNYGPVHRTQINGLIIDIKK